MYFLFLTKSKKMLSNLDFFLKNLTEEYDDTCDIDDINDSMHANCVHSLSEDSNAVAYFGLKGKNLVVEKSTPWNILESEPKIYKAKFERHSVDLIDDICFHIESWSSREEIMDRVVLEYRLHPTHEWKTIPHIYKRNNIVEAHLDLMFPCVRLQYFDINFEYRVSPNGVNGLWSCLRYTSHFFSKVPRSFLKYTNRFEFVFGDYRACQGFAVKCTEEEKKAAKSLFKKLKYIPKPAQD